MIRCLRILWIVLNECAETVVHLIEWFSEIANLFSPHHATLAELCQEIEDAKGYGK